ncbi:hypothetical protein LJC48_02685 [Desulfovibrio sp. OttesenSCG-928-C06]|nr:hypothetical protein [Desulfovibrio sp. OttesenSCG-928-C06]
MTAFFTTLDGLLMGAIYCFLKSITLDDLKRGVREACYGSLLTVAIYFLILNQKYSLNFILNKHFNLHIIGVMLCIGTSAFFIANTFDSRYFTQLAEKVITSAIFKSITLTSSLITFAIIAVIENEYQLAILFFVCVVLAIAALFLLSFIYGVNKDNTYKNIGYRREISSISSLIATSYTANLIFDYIMNIF